MSTAAERHDVLAALQLLANDPGKFLYVARPDARRTPLFVSAGVEALVGYPPGEWLADPGLFWRCLHPADRPRVEGALAAWDGARPLELSYRLRRRDGRLVFCRETATAPQDGPSGPQLQGLVIDESEVRLLMDALDSALPAPEPSRSISSFCDGLAALLGLQGAGFVDERGSGTWIRYDDHATPIEARALGPGARGTLAARACHTGLVTSEPPDSAAGLLPESVPAPDVGFAFASCVPGLDGRSRGVLYGHRPTRLTLTDRDRRLVASLSRHASLALQRTDLVSELNRIGADRQRLAESVVMAHEDERRRIASELHDGAGQTLMAAVIQLDLAAARLGTPLAAEAIGRARKQLEETLEDLRGLAHALRPATLDRLGLADALREMAGALTGTTLRVEVELADTGIQLEAEVATAVFRIAQSSLTNVARHARAQTATLRLERRGPELVLEVDDDGRGIQKAPMVDGIGLLAMRERAHAVGGSLDVESRPGGGTRVRVRIPVG